MSLSSILLIAILYLSLAPKAIAHEHGDEIADGQAVSADPIVVPYLLEEGDGDSNEDAGYHFMGSHWDSNPCLRSTFSQWHGPRGTVAFTAD
jgi:hypothetical protein